MQDVLYCAYAVILLTADELFGPPCPVPAIVNNPKLTAPRPGWLNMGSAAFMVFGPDPRDNDETLGAQYLARSVGGLPEKRVDYEVPTLLRPRLGDPNAGKAPVEHHVKSDYESRFDDGFRLKPWAKSLGPCHLGGTACPSQAMPQIGPHYIEFEEYFGGYNFGSGNAQLDLKSFKFDWAC